MAVTNLTGYTWVGKDEIEPTWGDSVENFSINFISNSTNFTQFNLEVYDGLLLDIYYNSTNAYNPSISSWTNSNFKTIIINGGTDVTNSTLISRLEEIGTLTPPQTPTVEKIYKGSTDVTDMLDKIYLGDTLIWENAPEPELPYVIFVSDSARTITPKYSNAGVQLQYSIDSGSTWVNIANNANTPSAVEIWFRGQATGTKGLYSSFNATNNPWKFNGVATNKVRVYGNIMFLLCDNLGDLEAPTTINQDYALSHMFYQATALVEPPELGATTLSNNCYNYMFYGCTSLTTATALPATTLSNNCYSYMFQGCTSLTTATALPATTLSNNCYSGMFYDCSSLTITPELPATTLSNNCYDRMFVNCTSLVVAPELPATTLSSSCYNQMFLGCTGLTTLPKLIALEIPSNAHSYMFYNCSNIKISETQGGIYQYEWRIPTTGTGTGTVGSAMFTNTGGTFTGTPNINTTYYTEFAPV